MLPRNLVLGVFRNSKATIVSQIRSPHILAALCCVALIALCCVAFVSHIRSPHILIALWSPGMGGFRIPIPVRYRGS